MPDKVLADVTYDSLKTPPSPPDAQFRLGFRLQRGLFIVRQGPPLFRV